MAYYITKRTGYKVKEVYMEKYTIEDAYALSACILDNMQEQAPHGSDEFPCAHYLDRYFLGQSMYPWHWHEEFEIAFVTRGRVTVKVNEVQYELFPGKGIFIGSHTLHAFSLVGTEEAEMPNIVFSPSLLYGTRDSIFWKRYMEPLLMENAFMNIPLTRQVEWQAEILNHASTAFSCLNERKFGYEFDVRDLLSKVVLLLLQNNPGMTPEKKSQKDINRVRQMLGYIQTNYTEPLCVEQIASCVNISPRECGRSFKKIVGVSPIQYVIELRIRRAGQLLAETDLPVTEICAFCGFESQSYFSKVFRERLGVSPLAYRKQKR